VAKYHLDLLLASSKARAYQLFLDVAPEGPTGATVSLALERNKTPSFSSRLSLVQNTKDLSYNLNLNIQNLLLETELAIRGGFLASANKSNIELNMGYKSQEETEAAPFTIQIGHEYESLEAKNQSSLVVLFNAKHTPSAIDHSVVLTGSFLATEPKSNIQLSIAYSNPNVTAPEPISVQMTHQLDSTSLSLSVSAVHKPSVINHSLAVTTSFLASEPKSNIELIIDFKSPNVTSPVPILVRISHELVEDNVNVTVSAKHRPSDLDHSVCITGTVVATEARSNFDLSIDYKSPNVSSPMPLMVHMAHEIDLSEGGESSLRLSVKHVPSEIDESVVLSGSVLATEAKSDIRVNIVASLLKDAITVYVSHDLGEGSSVEGVRKSSVSGGVKHLGSDLDHSIDIRFESDASVKNGTVHLAEVSLNAPGLEKPVRFVVENGGDETETRYVITLIV